MTAISRIYHNDPHVQVNIWLGKDKEGFTTTSSEGGRLSDDDPENLARCGHVSMTIFSKYTSPTYVSFWPDHEKQPVIVKGRPLLRDGEQVYEWKLVGGQLLENMQQDIKQEKSLPDVIICLFKLNIEAMLKALTIAKKRIAARDLIWALRVSNAEDATSSNVKRASCATFAYSLLRAGGFINAYKGFISGRGPRDRTFYDITKCGAGDRAGGLFNGAPWTNKVFSPKALLLRVASAAGGNNKDRAMTLKIMQDPTKVAEEKQKKSDAAGFLSKQEKKVATKKEETISIDEHGRNNLHIAAALGNMKDLRAILSKDYDDLLELEDETGLTPLLLAVYFGHVEAVELLLGFGGDPFAQNQDGFNAMHLAVHREHPKIVEHLLKNCPDLLESRDKNGDTPLIHSTLHNCIPTCNLLLKADADPSVRNNNGKNAFHYAALGKTEMLELLLTTDWPKQLEHQDENGCTPLILAAKNGYLACCNLLVQAGASCNPTNIDGKTAYQLALEAGYQEVAEFLGPSSKGASEVSGASSGVDQNCIIA